MPMLQEATEGPRKKTPICKEKDVRTPAILNAWILPAKVDGLKPGLQILMFNSVQLTLNVDTMIPNEKSRQQMS